MKMETERIVNIHELERLLSEVYIKSQELLMNCDPELCPLADEVVTGLEKARHFEFRLERRIIQRSVDVEKGVRDGSNTRPDRDSEEVL